MNILEMERNARTASGFLKTLANLHRLLILCHLTEGEMRVSELEERLGMRQPHLSQHLARLRKDGLVKTRRNSRTIAYSLGSPEAEQVIGLLYQLFCPGGVANCTPLAAKRPRGNVQASARERATASRSAKGKRKASPAK